MSYNVQNIPSSEVPDSDKEVLKQMGFDFEPDMEPIAHGVQGTVFRGQCNRYARRKGIDGQEVAITGQCVIKMCVHNTQGVSTLDSEAKLLEELRHPNVVEVYMNLRSGLRRYFVLEYMNSGTLRERLGPQSPSLTESDAFEIISQVTCGLHYLHKQNIAHGDLHQGNIMVNVDNDGHHQYKLVDFGRSKSLREVRSTDEIEILATHLISVLEKSDFTDVRLKRELRFTCDCMTNGIITTMDVVLQEMRRLLPKHYFPDSPQLSGFLANIRKRFFRKQ
jgi:serine/threonine protein kinase